MGKVVLPQKFGWGVLYGAAGGIGAVLVNQLPQVRADEPLVQAFISVAVTAVLAGVAKGLKFLAGKAGQ